MKEQKLDLYETFKTEKKTTTTEKKSDESGDPGFMKKLTDTIVNNLQVKVKDVHIRYEDLTDENVIFLNFIYFYFLEPNCWWFNIRRCNYRFL